MLIPATRRCVSVAAYLSRYVREENSEIEMCRRNESQRQSGGLFRVRSEAEVSLRGLVSLPRALEARQA